MHNLFKATVSLTASFLFCLSIFCLQGLPVQADSVYTNPDTGYEIIIEDDAGLLTDSEQNSLKDIMKEITAYGNVAFKTISINNTSTSSYIRSYYSETFGTSSGTVFLIDMDNRNLWIYGDGAIYKKITKSYAEIITDNVYTYATKENYYDCAYQAYSQILARLNNQRIAQPMKYISNAFLAATLALLVNYFFVKLFSKAKQPTNAQLLQGIQTHCNIDTPNATFSYQSRYYNPVSSGSGSSGGGSSGGGSSSSSSSGGGGGHSF